MTSCNLLSFWSCVIHHRLYLTQQNIILSNNGSIFSFSIDQLAYPFYKHILLGNDIKMQYFSCHAELRRAY